MTSTDVVQDGLDPVVARPGVLAMPRGRGNVLGILLILLGLWGGLSPLIGPWFGYHVDDEQAWILTWDRLWLTTVPGAATLVGGVLLYLSRDRLTAAVGCWLALAGGAWFVVGPSVSALWSSDLSATGIGRGNSAQQVLVQLLSFYGLGVAITALSSFALARVLIRSERDVTRLRDEAAAATEAAALREQRDRAQGEADQAAQARAATEREHQQAQREREQLQYEREQLRTAGAAADAPIGRPVIGTGPMAQEPAGTTYQPVTDPGPGPNAEPMALPGQRLASGAAYLAPAPTSETDDYRSTPTEPGSR